MHEDRPDPPGRVAGWSSYRPAPSIATAWLTPSLELRVSASYGRKGYELLILDLDDEAGEVSQHGSLEEAQRFASERTGFADIDWDVVGPERLAVRPEVGAESPLGTEQGDMVTLDDFPLEPGFQTKVEVWASSAWERNDAGVRREAEELRTELARQLGEGFEIMFDQGWS